jgi:hypothetical protein
MTPRVSLLDRPGALRVCLVGEKRDLTKACFRSIIGAYRDNGCDGEEYASDIRRAAQ